MINKQHFGNFMMLLSISNGMNQWHHEDVVVLFVFIIADFILKLLL